MNDSVAVCVIHILEVDNNIVLSCHVISDIVIDYESQKSIQESQIDFLVDFLETGFQQNNTLAFRSIPDSLEVIDTLTPFVN